MHQLRRKGSPVNNARRRSLLGVTAALVAVAWGLDRFAVGQPRSADGAAPPPEGVTLFADSADVDQLILALQDRADKPSPVVHRDLFDPANLAGASAAGATPSALPIESLTPQPAPPSSFTLTAILDGRIRMAVVNDRVVTRGTMLGEFRVARIESDHVILHGPNEVRRLSLARPDVGGAADSRDPQDRRP